MSNSNYCKKYRFVKQALVRAAINGNSGSENEPAVYEGGLPRSKTLITNEPAEPDIEPFVIFTIYLLQKMVCNFLGE